MSVISHIEKERETPKRKKVIKKRREGKRKEKIQI